MSVEDVIRDPANQGTMLQSLDWTHIIVHHTGAWERSPQQVKDYHLSLGWRDVGYNYLIDYAGKVHAGRSLSIPGAHCIAGNMNFRGIGIALLGNFEEKTPTPNQMHSLFALSAELCAEHQVHPDRILGHGEVPGAYTGCPGRYLDLSAVRRVVKRVVIKNDI